jgi:hypothetical protein
MSIPVVIVVSSPQPRNPSTNDSMIPDRMNLMVVFMALLDREASPRIAKSVTLRITLTATCLHVAVNTRAKRLRRCDDDLPGNNALPARSPSMNWATPTSYSTRLPTSGKAPSPGLHIERRCIRLPLTSFEDCSRSESRRLFPSERVERSPRHHGRVSSRSPRSDVQHRSHRRALPVVLGRHRAEAAADR